MSTHAWGDTETQFFFDLTPDKILDAVEQAGFRCTGRCLTLNSLENRVYEVELEIDDKTSLKSPSEAFRIVKFYRPGRWSEDQILEEHEFLNDLRKNEIPVVAPLAFSDGKTLKKTETGNIWYTVFPRMGGRSPDELNDDQLEMVGRLLARLHQVGASRPSHHRLRLDPRTYGRDNLEYLLTSKIIPAEIESRYKDVVLRICDLTEPWFESASYQRIHGDCHLGNLLIGSAGLFWVDFDDMVLGPTVQDLWLLIPGRDEYARRQLEILLSAYEEMRDFDRSSLRLIEPLRALRFVHFAAWIAKRWKDPIFPKYFVHFGTPRYWQEQLQDLEDQWEWVQNLSLRAGS